MIDFTKKNMFALIGCLAVCFLASAVGASASLQAESFYAQLIQPQWAPPSWLFGPVWSVLYIMMGISAWLIWGSGGVRKNKAILILFLVQLSVNAIWSWLFFAWKLGAIAFLDILLLEVLIVSTIIAFWRVNIIAAILLIPYFLWVSFAMILNLAIWQLNPQIFS